ncbi:EVE domain-containing protein, partial [Candidatus Bipolaricaulota bacterium]|nr:EVE domain-containing protein [Candidatus Bipolaricaulota bacterium]
MAKVFNIKGEELEISREDVKKAFEETEESIEDYEFKYTDFHFLELDSERKPVKKVFRNVKAVKDKGEDFGFNTKDAERVFKKLDFDIYNKRLHAPELFRECLQEIILEYDEAKKDDFHGDQRMYKLLKGKGPSLVKHILGENFEDTSNLLVNGSAGQDNWADIPWIAILHEDETTTIQEGMYVVYLFDTVQERITLKLASGVKKLKDEVGKKEAREQLREKAEEIRSKIDIPGFNEGELEYETTGVGELYGPGTSFYKTYSLGDIPQPQELEDDLVTVTRKYEQLIENDLNERGTRYWMLHPGKNQKYWDKWKKDNYIAIGGEEVDYSKGNIDSQIEENFPAESVSYVKSVAHKFVEEMDEGDIVLVCGEKKVLRAAEITSELYVEGTGDIHRKDVKWLTKEALDISGFPEDFLNKATSRYTILEFTEKSNIDLIKRRILKEKGPPVNGSSSRMEMVKQYKESRNWETISDQIRENVLAVKALAQGMVETGEADTDAATALYYLCLIDDIVGEKRKKERVDILEIKDKVKNEVKDHIDEDTGIVGGTAYQQQLRDEEEENAFLELLDTVLNSENNDEQLKAVEKFASKDIEGIQSGRLSPILFMLSPETFPINNKLSRDGMKKYFGKEVSPRLEEYVNDIEKYKKVRDEYGFKENYRDLDYFFIWADQNIEKKYSIQEILDRVFINEDDAENARSYFAELIEYLGVPEELEHVLNTTYRQKRKKISINCGPWQLLNIERLGPKYKAAFAVDSTELPQGYEEWSEYIEHINTFDEGKNFALKRFMWEKDLLQQLPDLRRAWKKAIQFAGENFKDWESSPYQPFHNQEVYQWIMDGVDLTTSNYFWVTANPKIWSVDDLKEKGEIFYSARNKKLNKRRIYGAFEKATPGDKVVFYESTPTKYTKALGEIKEGMHKEDEEGYDEPVEGITISYVRDMEQVTWEDLSDVDELENSKPIVNGAQGSLFELTEEEYNAILALEPDPGKKEESIPQVDLSREIELDSLYFPSNETARLKSQISSAIENG